MRLHKTSLLTAARLTMIALLSVSFGLAQCGGGGDGNGNGGNGVEYPYVCTNGTATVGTSTTQNEQNCNTCDTGYNLNGTACNANTYSCANGMPTSGRPTSDGEPSCASCNTGYNLNGIACELLPGTGTADDPYNIENYTSLLCMGRSGATTSGVNCSSYAAWTLAKHYRLVQNINANASCPNYDGTNGDTVTCGASQKAWVPVGDDSAGDTTSRFTGSFDGMGFTITNLYYKKSASGVQYGGLFGYTDDASIKNVGIENVYVNVVSSDSSSYAGALVGRMGGSSISNSYATGGVSASSSSFSTANAGALVGSMSGSSSISNSYATGGVSASSSSISISFASVGGLVGLMTSSSISNSYATGGVSASSSSTANAGALVGYMQSSSSISNSYATGGVASSGSSGSSVGGLVGWMQGGSSISNSYATGNVSASSSGTASAGGLVGHMQGSSSSLSNSYATGNVSASSSGTASAGGLVGNFSAGAILGKNYYVAANGIGSGETCANAVCIRPTAADNAARRTWLQTSDESTAAIFPTDATGTDHDSDNTTPNITWATWDSSVWGDFTTAGKFPTLKYGDNPHTADDPDTDEVDENIDECELLPGHGNTTAGLVRCGDPLPDQELYRASGNVTFSNATIGTPSTSAPEFFYSVSAGSVTVTYNLPSGITLHASAVEDANGATASNVAWDDDSSSDGTTGQVTDIDASDTFWLRLTFQKGSVTHTVRWKFDRPSS